MGGKKVSRKSTYNEGDAIAQLKRRACLGALLSYPRRVLPSNLAVRVGVISGIFFDLDALEERNKDEVIQSETAQKCIHHDPKSRLVHVDDCVASFLLNHGCEVILAFLCIDVSYTNSAARPSVVWRAPVAILQ